MFIAIFKLAGLLAILAVFVIWIISLVESDGRCHMDSCDGCPFDPEECPMKERNQKDDRDEETDR